MNDKSYYPLERLACAIDTLIASRGKIKERLYFAYMSDLHPLSVVDFENYSEETISGFTEMISKLENHVNFVNKESSFNDAKSEGLTEEDASDLARTINELYYLVSEELKS